MRAVSVASDLYDFSIHFISFRIISLITLLFLLPYTINFHDVVDKYLGTLAENEPPTRKTASDTWVIEKNNQDIARLGYQDVILKGDCEPTLVQVLENVRICPRSTFHHPAFTSVRTGRKTVQDK